MGKHRSVIYLQTRQGSKPKGKKVVLHFSSGMTSPVYTDGEGKVVIEHSSKGNATVYVNGRNKGQLKCPGEKYIFL